MGVEGCNSGCDPMGRSQHNGAPLNGAGYFMLNISSQKIHPVSAQTSTEDGSDLLHNQQEWNAGWPVIQVTHSINGPSQAYKQLHQKASSIHLLSLDHHGPFITSIVSLWDLDFPLSRGCPQCLWPALPCPGCNWSSCSSCARWDVHFSSMQ